VNRVLWTLQALLALVFLFSAVTKLLMPLDVLTQQLPLPGLFVRCIGAIELLGGLGLLLPALLRIRPGLTTLAAAGLALEMLIATLMTPMLTGGQLALAAIPLTMGLLSGVVAYGRWTLAPHARSSRRRVLQPAGQA
jgi:uncharacterized membrane protein